MATMAWTFAHGLLMAVHAEEPPTDEEWSGYMRETLAVARVCRGGLVLSEHIGKAAVSTQRAFAARQGGRETVMRRVEPGPRMRPGSPAFSPARTASRRRRARCGGAKPASA
jgi:hypothetical protein